MFPYFPALSWYRKTIMAFQFYFFTIKYRLHLKYPITWGMDILNTIFQILLSSYLHISLEKRPPSQRSYAFFTMILFTHIERVQFIMSWSEPSSNYLVWISGYIRNWDTILFNSGSLEIVLHMTQHWWVNTHTLSFIQSNFICLLYQIEPHFM